MAAVVLEDSTVILLVTAAVVYDAIAADDAAAVRSHNGLVVMVRALLRLEPRDLVTRDGALYGANTLLL